MTLSNARDLSTKEHIFADGRFDLASPKPGMNKSRTTV